jgi:hypothetical protein
MSHITITDETILAQLDSGTGPIVVRDATGQVRGYLTPIQPGDLQPRISEDELRRREADTTCKLYTTEEVIAKLRSL